MMPLDNALGGSQPQSNSFKLMLSMQALERLEKLLLVGHIKTDAIVAHKENRLAVLLSLAKFDMGGGMLRSEFESVYPAGSSTRYRPFIDICIYNQSGCDTAFNHTIVAVSFSDPG